MRIALASVLASAMLLLAACGSGSSSTTSTTATTSSTAASTPSAASTNPGTTTSTGSGTSTSAPPPPPPPSGDRTVAAVDGGFSTVVPKGFKTKTSNEKAVEYQVHRPAAVRATVITVFRGVAHGSVHAVATAAVKRLSELSSLLPPARDVSALKPLEVDGQSALYVDYRVGTRKPEERRQVFVIDGEWTYEISLSATPANFASSLGALEEVIDGWRWR